MKTKVSILITVLAISILVSTSTAKAESIVYILDNYRFAQVDSVSFNGDKIKLKQKPFWKKFYQIDEFKKGLTKCIIKNDGRLVVVRDLTWSGKPYHDEITLDLNDGDVYYLELVAGPKSKLKLLDSKKGAKEVEKILTGGEKDWIVNEEIVYEE